MKMKNGNMKIIGMVVIVLVIAVVALAFLSLSHQQSLVKGDTIGSWFGLDPHATPDRAKGASAIVSCQCFAEPLVCETPFGPDLHLQDPKYPVSCDKPAYLVKTYSTTYSKGTTCDKLGGTYVTDSFYGYASPGQRDGQSYTRSLNCQNAPLTPLKLNTAVTD